MLLEPSSPQPPAPNPYGYQRDQPQLTPDQQIIVANRDPELGQPVGKGDPGTAPILLAKMSKGQEIELECKAYKVSPRVSWSCRCKIYG